MCISNLNKVSTCILKPPTEYRFPFYLDPFKRGLEVRRKEKKISRGEDVDEISMGGLFHKRQNFLFCVSHLILSNKPKAIRPRAHCLKNAQFMRTSPPPPPSTMSGAVGCSASVFCKTKRRQMRFKSRDAKWHTRPGEWPGELVCLFVPRRNQRAKLQKAFVCCVYLQDGRHRCRINRAAPSPIWTLRISNTISHTHTLDSLFLVFICQNK